jgi:hypothetical protein
MRGRSSRPPRRRRGLAEGGAELRMFLCPETAFADPSEVVDHPDLSIREKRAILARWAALVCAEEAALDLKWMPAGHGERVGFDEVMDALRALESGHVANRQREAANTRPADRVQKYPGTIH